MGKERASQILEFLNLFEICFVRDILSSPKENKHFWLNSLVVLRKINISGLAGRQGQRVPDVWISFLLFKRYPFFSAGFVETF